MKMKGNIPLIDAIAALIIVLAIFGLIQQYEGDYRKLMQGYIEREELRALWYEGLFSGKVRWSDFSGGAMFPNGLKVTECPPDGIYLKFFLTDEGSTRLYFIWKEE